MDLKNIINLLGDIEQEVALPLFNKVKIAEKTNQTIFTNIFYSPNIYSNLTYFLREKGINIEANGGLEEAEKKLICFNPKENMIWPFKIIKITTPMRFNNLVHKDYLGAILALGIQRNKIGDLRLIENKCYLPVIDEILEYILYNLKTIGKLKCSCEEVLNIWELPKVKFEENIVLSSSLRLDGLVSALTNKSRNDSVKLITSGFVSINYKVMKDKSFLVKENYRVTIKGYGKYIINNSIGETKNGRLKVAIKKFS